MTSCSKCKRQEFIEQLWTKAPVVPTEVPKETWTAYDKKWSMFLVSVYMALFDYDCSNH